MQIRRLLLIGLALAPFASAQNVFLAVEEKGPPKIVKRVSSFNRPIVETDGKPTVSSANEFALGRALAYRPGLITLSNFRIQNRHLVSRKSGATFNYELRIFGDAKSDVELKDCFLVLEINAWKAAGYVWTDLHDFAPGESKQLNADFKLDGPLQEGTYRLHIFSAGVEVLQTRMSAHYIAAQQQKTQGLLSRESQDFPPIPAHPAPLVYPAELKGEKRAGSAQVKCLVSANGDVKSVELVSATEPAFGVAALAAAPKWKFDPAVKARHFVEGEAVIPIEFKIPK